MRARYVTHLLAIAICFLLQASSATIRVFALPPGLGTFFWDDETGESDPDKPLTVYYYRPDEVSANTPVWMIMHGTNRNADDYRDYFVDAATAQGAIVVAPEFSKAQWAGSRGYNLGNISVSESNRTPRIERDWSFSKIEPLFDYLTKSLEPALEADSYYMYGHSAGSQFTHRFLAWKPDARVKLAVAANAGWYTTPQYSDTAYPYNWPYSLEQSPDYVAETTEYDSFPELNLDAFLARRMIVLLGDQDLQRSSSLRQTPEADAQGLNRFARGHFFYSEGQAEALAKHVEFGWQLQVVPGVAHSGSQMAIPAAELFRRAHLAPADYDQNGRVDRRDLEIWEREYASSQLADANADHDSDGDDFLLWQRSFESTAESMALGSVPEPASLLLTCTSMVAFSIGRSTWMLPLSRRHRDR